jgi:hypothetical protein
MFAFRQLETPLVCCHAALLDCMHAQACLWVRHISFARCILGCTMGESTAHSLQCEYSTPVGKNEDACRRAL